MIVRTLILLTLAVSAVAACKKTGEGEVEIKTPTIGTQTDTLKIPTIEVGTDTHTVVIDNDTHRVVTPDIDIKSRKARKADSTDRRP
jgi:hypothetical protein